MSHLLNDRFEMTVIDSWEIISHLRAIITDPTRARNFAWAVARASSSLPPSTPGTNSLESTGYLFLPLGQQLQSFLSHYHWTYFTALAHNSQRLFIVLKGDPVI